MNVPIIWFGDWMLEIESHWIINFLCFAKCPAKCMRLPDATVNCRSGNAQKHLRQMIAANWWLLTVIKSIKMPSSWLLIRFDGLRQKRKLFGKVVFFSFMWLYRNPSVLRHEARSFDWTAHNNEETWENYLTLDHLVASLLSSFCTQSTKESRINQCSVLIFSTFICSIVFKTS